MKDQALEIRADASPLRAFIDLLKLAPKRADSPIDISELGSELVRVEADGMPGSAGELVVRLYPSDRLLRFAATVLAGEG